MSTATRVEERLAQYAFVVYDISGDLESYWRTANVPQVTFEVGSIREGGAQFPVKEVTIGDVDNFTLSRGLVPIRTSLWDWLTESGMYTAGLPTGAGVASPNNLRNLVIAQLRRDRTVAVEVTCYNCQCRTWKPGGFDNMSSDIQVEEAEIVCEGLDVTYY